VQDELGWPKGVSRWRGGNREKNKREAGCWALHAWADVAMQFGWPEAVVLIHARAQTIGGRTGAVQGFTDE
jgi:hypothetical protein